MQDAVADRKAQILWEKYHDNKHADIVQRDIETIRKNAAIKGAVTTGGLFLLNEAARLSFRSPLFKLSPLNSVLLIVAPTLAFRNIDHQQIEEKLAKMWEVHKNRKDAGRDGTVSATNVHESYNGDWMEQRLLHNGFNTNLNSIVFGLKYKSAMNKPFHRFKHQIGENNFDPVAAQTLQYEQDNLERTKPFMPKIEGDIAGQTHIIPRTTSDSDPHFYNNQGESIWSNPWPFNVPFVDHQIDEDDIWNVPKTIMNIGVMQNPWTFGEYDAENNHYFPRWTGKLSIPQWMNKAKMAKWHRHYNYRLELSQVLKRQAEQYRNRDVEVQGFEASAEDEMNDFMARAHAVESSHSKQGFAVTDHSYQPRQLMTNSEEEDEEYFKLIKAFEEYNSDIATEEVLTKADPKRHPRGSLIQKILDPYTDGKVNEEGILELELSQKDLKSRTEEQYREIFDRFKANNEEEFECDTEEDPEEGRVALLKEIDANEELFEKIDTKKLDAQFAAFLEHEDYSFVKDMKKHYHHELQKSEAQRILEKIPEHAFWDIKKPQQEVAYEPVSNRTNPNRPRNFDTWFEAVEFERNMDIHNGDKNLRSAMSEFRRY